MQHPRPAHHIASEEKRMAAVRVTDQDMETAESAIDVLLFVF